MIVCVSTPRTNPVCINPEHNLLFSLCTNKDAISNLSVNYCNLNDRFSVHPVADQTELECDLLYNIDVRNSVSCVMVNSLIVHVHVYVLHSYVIFLSTKTHVCWYSDTLDCKFMSCHKRASVGLLNAYLLTLIKLVFPSYTQGSSPKIADCFIAPCKSSCSVLFTIILKSQN